MTHHIGDRSTWRPSTGHSPPRERMVMLARLNPHGRVLRAKTHQARGLRCQRGRGRANEEVPRIEQISSLFAPNSFAIPALDLHTSTQERRRSHPLRTPTKPLKERTMLAKFNRHGWRGEAFAIPALELHASTLKRRRSEQSTCQTGGSRFPRSALQTGGFSALRAPKPRKRSDMTCMHARPTSSHFIERTAGPDLRGSEARR